MFKKNTDEMWFVSTMAVFLCLAIVAMALAQTINRPALLKGRLSPEQAGQKLNYFLSKAYGDRIGKIAIAKVTEGNGLYKVDLSITNQDQTTPETVYMSQDGKFFIPGPQDIDQTLAQIAAQTAPSPQNDQAAQNLPKSDEVKVEMFTMSYCPYGNQAEAGIIPAAKLLGDKINIEPHYVIYNNYQGGGDDYCMSSGKYCSMHGIEELRQDVRELCINKYQPNVFWDYLDKVNAKCTLQDIATCWETQAVDLGINVAKIKTCLSNEAETMLAKEVELNTKYSISGSPDILINGTRYQGGRTPEDYKTAFCGAFNSPPEQCSQTLGETSTATTGGCG